MESYPHNSEPDTLVYTLVKVYAGATESDPNGIRQHRFVKVRHKMIGNVLHGQVIRPGARLLFANER